MVPSPAPPPSEPQATNAHAETNDLITQSHNLVARWLRSQGYHDTLAAFKRETLASYSEALHLELEDDEGQSNKGPDLREVVEEFLSSRMQALQLPQAPLDEELGKIEVTMQLPEKVGKTIRDSTNVLTVRPGVFPQRSWDAVAGHFKSEFIPAIFTTAVDRTIKVYSTATYDLLATFPFKSPILSVSIHPLHPRLLIAGTMEGSLSLLDLVTRDVKQRVQNHTKYIVRTVWSADGRWVATAGYDRQLQVYEVVESEKTEVANTFLDGEEPDELAILPNMELVLRKTLYLKNNPEAMVFLPSTSHLVYSARDDNVLHYLKLPSPKTSTAATPSRTSDWAETGINLNENGDAWVSFSVLYITLHPTLPILSLQTSTDNSRILLYPFHSPTRLATLFTTASQSEFTTPRHSWLPDGSAVVVNSEDGVLRVVDLKGRVLKKIGVHGIAAPLERDELGSSREEISERLRLRRETERGSSVVKDVAVLRDENDKLVFVSCGFDKTVKVIHV